MYPQAEVLDPVGSGIQLYPIWIISCQIQSMGCHSESIIVVLPEETMARGAEQSQAGFAHTNVGVFIIGVPQNGWFIIGKPY